MQALRFCPANALRSGRSLARWRPRRPAACDANQSQPPKRVSRARGSRAWHHRCLCPQQQSLKQDPVGKIDRAPRASQTPTAAGDARRRLRIAAPGRAQDRRQCPALARKPVPTPVPAIDPSGGSWLGRCRCGRPGERSGWDGQCAHECRAGYAHEDPIEFQLWTTTSPRSASLAISLPVCQASRRRSPSHRVNRGDEPPIRRRNVPWSICMRAATSSPSCSSETSSRPRPAAMLAAISRPCQPMSCVTRITVIVSSREWFVRAGLGQGLCGRRRLEPDCNWQWPRYAGRLDCNPKVNARAQSRATCAKPRRRPVFRNGLPMASSLLVGAGGVGVHSFACALQPPK